MNTADYFKQMMNNMPEVAIPEMKQKIVNLHALQQEHVVVLAKHRLALQKANDLLKVCISRIEAQDKIIAALQSEKSRTETAELINREIQRQMRDGSGLRNITAPVQGKKIDDRTPEQKAMDYHFSMGGTSLMDQPNSEGFVSESQSDIDLS